MISGLKAALERLAGPDIAVAVQEVAASSKPLWAEERIAMARAVPSRLAEFTAGRAAARAAMQALGLPELAIPMGPDRAPVWPAGVVGSMSHTGGICVALVGRTDQVSAIGVDLELNEPLEPDLWAEVCSADERTYLNGLPDGGRVARLIFSAKECSYKCIYPHVRTILGFDAMTILPDAGEGVFAAKPMRQLGPFGPDTVLRGGYAVIGGLIATVMVLR